MLRLCIVPLIVGEVGVKHSKSRRHIVLDAEIQGKRVHDHSCAVGNGRFCVGFPSQFSNVSHNRSICAFDQSCHRPSDTTGAEGLVVEE